MRVCLFEDRSVANLEPLTRTRPVFDLLCGQTSLAAKHCRFFAPCEVGVLVRPLLADLCRLQQPSMPVNDLSWLRAESTVLVNGRWLPTADSTEDFSRPCVATVGNEIAYALVGPELLAGCSSNTLEDCLETWKDSLPRRRAGGYMVHYLWDLVEANGQQIALDFRHRLANHPPARISSGIAIVGPQERLFLDPTAHIDPMVVVDTTHGPVIIDQCAVVSAFSRIEGPCSIGLQTQVMGAKIRGGTTLGPNCRVGGEIEATIIQGYSNKYHEGFLGHSYVGEWVNLGAGTFNSDLRNDYRPISVTVNGDVVPTGLTKVGCFIGDHTKTGLGTLLNTGTNAGIFCNLLPGGGFLPKYIPSFSSWWNGALRDQADLPRLLPTIAEVMRRRGESFTAVHATLYRQLCDQTASERCRVLFSEEKRVLRRSA